MQQALHYFLHLGFPLLLAYVFFRRDWVRVYLVFIGTMLVDLDHLFASPIFQADRCSIAFHPLHTYWAMLVYILLLFFRKPFRWIGIGLLLHMATDLIDCMWLYAVCESCMIGAPALGLVEKIVGVF